MSREKLPCGFHTRLPKFCAGRKCSDCALRKDQYYGTKQKQTKEEKDEKE